MERWVGGALWSSGVSVIPEHKDTGAFLALPIAEPSALASTFLIQLKGNFSWQLWTIATFGCLWSKFCLSLGEFPGGPVVETSPSEAGSMGSIPDQGTKIPHTSWPRNQNIKQNNIITNSTKTNFKKKREPLFSFSKNCYF